MTRIQQNVIKGKKGAFLIAVEAKHSVVQTFQLKRFFSLQCEENLLQNSINTLNMTATKGIKWENNYE